MAADEAQAATTAPKGVHPCPRPIKKAPADSDEGQPAALADDSDDPAAAYAEHSKDTANGDGDLEVDSDEGHWDSEQNQTEEREESGDVDTTKTTCAGDQKGKLADSLRGTSACPPPSSIFSAFSRSTAATSLPDPSPMPCTGSNDDLLVGGYADEDLLNDSQEYAVAMQSRGKGKQIMKTNLHIVTPRPMDRTSDQVLAFGTGALNEQSESSIEAIESNVMDVDPEPFGAKPIHIKQEPQSHALSMSLDNSVASSRNIAAKAPTKTHRRTTSFPPVKKVKKETIPVILVPDSEESDFDDIPNGTAVQAPQATASTYWTEKNTIAGAKFSSPPFSFGVDISQIFGTSLTPTLSSQPSWRFSLSSILM
ncbi:hypothetical protein BU15DRAFT_76969 [Melanogaster broomeanus]|nr:hypothetical protein BU15DRAFT_76969 [Melanogaster broomeanus]